LGRLQEITIYRIQNEQVFDLCDEITEFSESEVITAYFQLLDELFFFSSLRCLLQPDVKETEHIDSLKFLSSTHDAKKIAPKSKPTTSSSSNRAAVNDTSDFEAPCAICCRLCATPFSNCGDAKLGVVTTCGYVWQDMAVANEDALSDAQFLNLRIPLKKMEFLIEILQAYSTTITHERLR
ncbi:hypothetical protein BUE80_DR008971, partial [Diplocarpon rosae]